jgi:hypothetical protein
MTEFQRNWFRPRNWELSTHTHLKGTRRSKVNCPSLSWASRSPRTNRHAHVTPTATLPRDCIACRPLHSNDAPRLVKCLVWHFVAQQFTFFPTHWCTFVYCLFNLTILSSERRLIIFPPPPPRNLFLAKRTTDYWYVSSLRHYRVFNLGYFLNRRPLEWTSFGLCSRWGAGRP